MLGYLWDRGKLYGVISNATGTKFTKDTAIKVCFNRNPKKVLVIKGTWSNLIMTNQEEVKKREENRTGGMDFSKVENTDKRVQEANPKNSNSSWKY